MHKALRFLTDRDHELLMEGAERRSYRPDESILEEGAPNRTLFLIREGRLRVERDHMGQSIAHAYMRPGEIFGEMSLLEETTASASIVADEAAEVDAIPLEHIAALIESEDGFAGRFYRSLAVDLAQRLRERTAMLLPPQSWG